MKELVGRVENGSKLGIIRQVIKQLLYLQHKKWDTLAFANYEPIQCDDPVLIVAQSTSEYLVENGPEPTMEPAVIDDYCEVIPVWKICSQQINSFFINFLKVSADTKRLLRRSDMIWPFSRRSGLHGCFIGDSCETKQVAKWTWFVHELPVLVFLTAHGMKYPSDSSWWMVVVPVLWMQIQRVRAYK